jgi:hypothetical protein
LLAGARKEQRSQDPDLAPVEAEPPKDLFLVAGDVKGDPRDASGHLVYVDLLARSSRSQPVEQSVGPILVRHVFNYKE